MTDATYCQLNVKSCFCAVLQCFIKEYKGYFSYFFTWPTLRSLSLPEFYRQHIRYMCQDARAETTQAKDNLVCESLYFTPLYAVSSYVSAHMNH